MNRSAPFQTALAAVALPLLLAHGSAHAECFSMYDAKNALVYQSGTSPIDLTHSVSEEMARHFPARSLVISNTLSCGDDAASNGSGGDAGFGPAGDFGGTSTAPAASRSGTASASDGTNRTRAPGRGR